MKTVTIKPKAGKRYLSNGVQDRSWTDDICKLENGELFVWIDYLNKFHKINKEDYIITDASNFIVGDDKAKNLAKASNVFKKTKKGYKEVKRRIVVIGVSKTTGDRSYVGDKLLLVAENETHMQVVIRKSVIGRPYLKIIRKDEHNFSIK